MKKLAILVAAGLLFTGTAFAAPLSDEGTSTSTSSGMQGGQPGKANANEKTKSKMGTTGSGMNNMSGSTMGNSGAPAKDSMEKGKSPASPNAGIKQEK